MKHLRKVVLFVLAAAMGALMAGCAGQLPASVNGECRVFSDPGFAVQGKRLKDKQWIGKTQEQGIQVCNWKRPKQ